MSALSGISEIGSSILRYGKENQSFLKDTISNGFNTVGRVVGDLLTLDPVGAVKDYAGGIVNQGDRAGLHVERQLENIYGGF